MEEKPGATTLCPATPSPPGIKWRWAVPEGHLQRVFPPRREAGEGRLRHPLAAQAAARCCRHGGRTTINRTHNDGLKERQNHMKSIERKIEQNLCLPFFFFKVFGRDEVHAPLLPMCRAMWR